MDESLWKLLGGLCPLSVLSAFMQPTCVVVSVTYTGSNMKQSHVNAEERIDRFVGRRRAMADSLQTGMQLQKTAAQLHISFKHRWWPKGVYRFKTHEEANEWMTKMLAQSSLRKT